MGFHPGPDETDRASADPEETLLDVLPGLIRADPASTAELLSRLTDGAAALPTVDGAGAMWNLEGRLRHVTATDSFLSALQRQQERDQSGPSVEAYRTNETVCATGLRPDPRRRPVAVAALPLGGPELVAGVLTVWRGTNSAWPENDLVALGAMADLAAAQLVRHEQYELLQRVRRELLHALDARVLVEQAKGILAGERGITVDQALALLKRHARDRGRPLRAVAADVVSGRLRP